MCNFTLYFFMSVLSKGPNCLAKLCDKEKKQGNCETPYLCGQFEVNMVVKLSHLAREKMVKERRKFFMLTL